MKKIINKVKMFFAGEKGGETAEWAVIVGLLVIIGTTVYSPTGAIGTAIAGVGTSITTAIAG
jgi:Flp pilus assembly pilin Flp